MPAISVTGSEQWLGRWPFSLLDGLGMSDEPIFWADQIAKPGIDNVGVLVEQSLIGESYIKQFRRACRAKAASGSWPRSTIPQTAKDVSEQVKRTPRRQGRLRRPLRVRLRRGARRLRHARPSTGTRPASWAPPSRTPGSTRSLWNAMRRPGPASTSTTPRTRSARSSSTCYNERFGRRPEWCVPVVNRDPRRRPPPGLRRSPAAVRRGVPRRPRAGEDVPRRVGCAGHADPLRPLHQHRGRMGPGYLVARQLDPDGVTAHTCRSLR